MRLLAFFLSLFLLCGGLGLFGSQAKSGAVTEMPGGVAALLPGSEPVGRDCPTTGPDAAETDMARASGAGGIAALALAQCPARILSLLSPYLHAQANPARAPPPHSFPT
jgi:hypothetical protein